MTGLDGAAFYGPPAAISPAARVDTLVNIEAQLSHLYAWQLETLAAMAADPGCGALDREWVKEEVRAALGISAVAAQELLDLANALATGLTQTLAALKSGRLTFAMVRYLAEQTCALDDDAALEVEAQALAADCSNATPRGDERDAGTTPHVPLPRLPPRRRPVRTGSCPPVGGRRTHRRLQPRGVVLATSSSQARPRLAGETPARRDGPVDQSHRAHLLPKTRPVPAVIARGADCGVRSLCVALGAAVLMSGCADVVAGQGSVAPGTGARGGAVVSGSAPPGRADGTVDFMVTGHADQVSGVLTIDGHARSLGVLHLPYALHLRKTGRHYVLTLTYTRAGQISCSAAESSRDGDSGGGRGVVGGSGTLDCSPDG